MITKHTKAAGPTTKLTKTHAHTKILFSCVSSVFVCFVGYGAVLLAQARPQPGTKLPLDQVSAQMFHVSAGKRLKPASWPNGARVAVGLSFDVDNATADLATGNLISESISRGEYGAVDGVPRILRLLDKHNVPASFFIPAVSHLLHPQMIPDILKSGRHEIGVDDFPYFGGATNGGMPNPDEVERVFQSEFDVAYDEGGLFILTMHPHITGHRSRVAGLEKLIVHMKSKPGVWFATHEQIARYVRANSKT